MHDKIDRRHRAIDSRAVADIAANFADPIALGIIKVGDIKRDDFFALGEQVSAQVDAEEAGAAGDEKARHLGLALV